MDNMLQMQIIREDTRGLFVPTSIQKLVIDVKKHVQVLFALPDDAKGELRNILISLILVHSNLLLNKLSEPTAPSFTYSRLCVH